MRYPPSTCLSRLRLYYETNHPPPPPPPIMSSSAVGGPFVRSISSNDIIERYFTDIVRSRSNERTKLTSVRSNELRLRVLRPIRSNDIIELSFNDFVRSNELRRQALRPIRSNDIEIPINYIVRSFDRMIERSDRTLIIIYFIIMCVFRSTTAYPAATM